MQLTRFTWQWIVIPVLVASMLGGFAAQTATADEDQTTASTVEVENPFDLPDIEAGDQLPVMSTGSVPWLSQDETYYHGDKSVFWNQNFRGGMGQIRVNAAEYALYNYNNKDDNSDNGEIREIHHTLTLMGAPVPMLRLYVSFGINTISIDRGNDGNNRFENLAGITYELGIEFGVPIVELLVIEARFFWRRHEASKGSGTDFSVIGSQWNGSLVVVFEPLGERLGFTLNVYAGVGYHYHFQRWTFAAGTSNDITPDNSSTQTNGPERIDIIAGVNVMPIEWFSINLEARFVGPLYLVGSFSFIF